MNARAARELVLANHILAYEEVLDAYGHVSVRDPDNPRQFLLSRSRSPEIVDEGDILVHDLAGNVAGVAEPDLYRERFIHGAIYEARPEVNAVVHSHADDVLPFSISSIPFQAVSHGSSLLGSDPVPVWDIRKDFGDTNLLVSNVDQGRSLSRKLEQHSVVLMRGHGFAAASFTLIQVLKLTSSLPRNARTLLDAIALGGTVTPLSPGETAARNATDVSSPSSQRQWEYWCRKLGETYEPGGF